MALDFHTFIILLCGCGHMSLTSLLEHSLEKFVVDKQFKVCGWFKWLVNSFNRLLLHTYLLCSLKFSVSLFSISGS